MYNIHKFIGILGLILLMTYSSLCMAEGNSIKGSPDILLTPETWNSYTPDIPDVSVSYTTSAESRSGNPCLKIVVPRQVEGAFYHYYQDLTDVEKGAVYELTCWIRTEKVSGGVGAYGGIGLLEPAPPHERKIMPGRQ